MNVSGDYMEKDRYNAYIAAIELRYPYEYIKRICLAETSATIDRALVSARKSGKNEVYDKNEIEKRLSMENITIPR